MTTFADTLPLVLASPLAVAYLLWIAVALPVVLVGAVRMLRGML